MKKARTYEASIAGLSRIERIAPPMATAITVPVWCGRRSAVVYVSTSPFTCDVSRMTDAELGELAERIVDALNKKRVAKRG